MPTLPPVGLGNCITVQGSECQRGTVNPAVSSLAPLRALYHGYWYTVKDASGALEYFPTTRAWERVYTLYMRPDVACLAFSSRYLTKVQQDGSSNASDGASPAGRFNGGGAGSNGNNNQDGGNCDDSQANRSSGGTRHGNSSISGGGNNFNYNDYGNALGKTMPRKRHSSPATTMFLKPIEPPVPATGAEIRRATTGNIGNASAAAGSPRRLVGNEKAPPRAARMSPVVPKPRPVLAGARNAVRSGPATSHNARSNTNIPRQPPKMASTAKAAIPVLLRAGVHATRISKPKALARNDRFSQRPVIAI